MIIGLVRPICVSKSMTIEMELAPVRQQFLTDYQILKEHFLYIAKSRIAPSVLNTLKVTYSDVINSARCTDYIDSLEGLLRMLEKRGALSYDNIEPLKHISSTFVNDPGLERALREFEVRIGRGPPLPLCNVYEMPGGKYITEGPRSGRCVTLNSNGSSDSNSSDSTNDNDVNRAQGENELSPEDRSIIETEALVPRRPSTVKNRRDPVNGSVHAARVCEKICSKFGIGVTGALLGVALVILFVTISNSLYVQSSVSGLSGEERPGVSGVETAFDAFHPRGMQARMTVYTTQPAFRLTLPGSILLGPAVNQSAVRSDAEEARIVLLEISDRLGRSWRDVARNLGVRERDIDEIDHKHNVSLKEKAFQALQIFRNKCDPSQWKKKLKSALDEARRRDLAEAVDDLIEGSRSN